MISPEVINEHCPVILVAAITNRKADRLYPFEALLPANEAGLERRGKVLLMHLRSVDKRRLTGHYGAVSEDTRRKVEGALEVATGLA